MNIIKPILLFFLVFKIHAKDHIYTQKDIDDFINNELNDKTFPRLKSMLGSNDQLLGWSAYYRKKSYIHLKKNELDSVLIYGNKALSKFASINQSNINKSRYELEECLLKQIYLYMGIVFKKQRKYRQSTTYLYQATRLIDKYPDYEPGQNSYIFGSLATNFLEMGNKKEALKYRMKTLKDSAFMSVPNQREGVYNHIAILYGFLNQKDSCLHYYRKYLNESIKNKYFEGIRVASNNIGDFYRNEGAIDSALFYYKKSKATLDNHPIATNELGWYYTVSNFAYVLIKEGKIDQAIEDLKTVWKGISDIERTDSNIKILKATTLDYIIEAYERKGAFNLALLYAKKKSNILEEFHERELDQRIRDLSLAYEVDKKEASIQELKKTTSEQQLIIDQRNMLTFTFGGLLVAIIGIGFLIFRQRKLQTEYKTVNLEQRLLRSQLNPHFVFNALHTISVLAYKNSEKTSLYIGKLSTLIRLMLKNSREEFITVEDELKSIENYLQLQSNFSQKFTFSIEIDDTINKENMVIPPMFIQPCIENSIEHGFLGIENANIDIKMRYNEKDKLMKCLIIDNGVGVGKSKSGKENKYESYSGKILQERLSVYSRSLNKKASYSIKEVKNGRGTEVTMLLPCLIETL